VPAGTQLTITANPATGYAITDWGGACNNVPASQSTCTFVVTSATTGFSVTFSQLFQLTVSNAGNGSGTTAIAPGNLTCPPTCTANVVAGTQVTLTANPASGSLAGGFTGACVSSGATCTFTVNAAASVTANYNLAVVQATVVGRKTTKSGNVRRTRVTIDAEQVIDVDISIVRGGRELAGRFINNFRPGERSVFVTIPRGVAGGRAQLVVEMTNNFGVEKTQRFRIRIPSLA
jgi:hypothetical protein